MLQNKKLSSIDIVTERGLPKPVVAQVLTVLSPVFCPIGPNYYGTGNPCSLHYQLTAIRDRLLYFLKSKSLASFSKVTRRMKLESSLEVKA